MFFVVPSFRWNFSGTQSSASTFVTLFGAILGALIMASLDNGMNLVGVQSYVQPIVKGAVLVTADGTETKD